MTIDTRGLPPPEPLVRILAAIEGLGPGAETVALLDREPVFLYPELERRGWSWEIAEEGPWVRLTLRRGEWA